MAKKIYNFGGIMKNNNSKYSDEVLAVLKRLNELGVKAEILDENVQPEEKEDYEYFFGISLDGDPEEDKKS